MAINKLEIIRARGEVQLCRRGSEYSVVRRPIRSGMANRAKQFRMLSEAEAFFEKPVWKGDDE